MIKDYVEPAEQREVHMNFRSDCCRMGHQLAYGLMRAKDEKSRKKFGDKMYAKFEKAYAKADVDGYLSEFEEYIDPYADCCMDVLREHDMEHLIY